MTTINGRTPEEIKKGLECYITQNTGGCENILCRDCPHYDPNSAYTISACKDALAYIQQLESECKEARKEAAAHRAANAVLRETLSAVQRERDAAVEAVEKLVENCDRSIACDFCEYRDYQCIVCEFKWRGVQEVE